MSKARERVLAALRQAGLSDAQAEDELYYREAEAERLMGVATDASRDAAARRAREIIFAPLPLFVRMPANGSVDNASIENAAAEILGLAASGDEAVSVAVAPVEAPAPDVVIRSRLEQRFASPRPAKTGIVLKPRMPSVTPVPVEVRTPASETLDEPSASDAVVDAGLDGTSAEALAPPQVEPESALDTEPPTVEPETTAEVIVPAIDAELSVPSPDAGVPEAEPLAAMAIETPVLEEPAMAATSDASVVAEAPSETPAATLEAPAAEAAALETTVVVEPVEQTIEADSSQEIAAVSDALVAGEAPPETPDESATVSEPEAEVAPVSSQDSVELTDGDASLPEDTDGQEQAAAPEEAPEVKPEKLPRLSRKARRAAAARAKAEGLAVPVAAIAQGDHGMMRELRLGVKRYLRWLTTSPKWVLALNAVVPLVLVVSGLLFAGASLAERDKSASAASAVPTRGPALRQAPLATYSTAMAPILTAYSGWMDSVAYLSSNADAGNPNWLNQFIAVANGIKSTGALARQVPPPACVAGPHAVLMQAVDNLDLAADNIITGMPSLDPVALNEAARYLSEATPLLAQSTGEINNAVC